MVNMRKSKKQQQQAGVKDSVTHMTGQLVNQASKAHHKAVKLFVGGEMTWDELQAMEVRRKAVLGRVEYPFYRILMFWDGSALPILLTDPLFYISVALYVLVRLYARLGMSDSIQSLTTGDISVLGGFLSFFLVFYVVQTNNRFFELYNTSMAIVGRSFDVASLCRTSLPRSSGQKILRYMTAANLMAYIGMDSGYSYENFFVPINETNRFLTKAEVQRMLKIGIGGGGTCARELLVWALTEVDKNLKAGVIDPMMAYQIRIYILRARAAIGTLFDYAAQPVPFFYIHFISLLSSIYLPLFAISTAIATGTGDNLFWGSDVISGLIVVLQCVFVIGLRVLGQNMSDPYGMDIGDLCVLSYANNTWKLSMRVLYADDQPEITAAEENAIARQHQSVGDAFEANRLQIYTSNVSDDIELGVEIGE